MSELNIGTRADGSPFALPLDAAGETIAVLAKKGAGKSYTASVLTEELLEHQVRTVIVDPTSAWFGLRSSADGKSAGLPIVIFGGEHADVPLTPEMGEVVADVIVDDRISAVLDLGPFLAGEQIRFMTAFAERLYHRNRESMHLIVDEADAFAPQRALPEVARCLGALERIVRRGRIRGIGVTLITQRPAVLNKNVLTQLDTLVVLQMTAPQDRKAIDEWIEANASRAERDIVLASLAGLKKGEAWIWSPAHSVLERVNIRQRRTFDSSATPKAGERVAAPTVVAAVDLQELRTRLSIAIETAKSDNPKALRERIRQLEAAAAKAVNNIPEKLPPERVDVSVLTDADRELLRECIDAFTAGFTDVRARIAEVEDAWLPVIAPLVKKAAAALGSDEVARARPAQGAVHADDRDHTVPGASTHRVARDARAAEVAPALPRPQPTRVVSLGDLGGAPAVVLKVLAQFRDGRSTRRQVAALSGYGARKSTLRNALSALRQRDLIVTDGEAISLSAAGRKLAGPAPAPRTTSETIALWRSKFGGVPRSLFDVLVRAYPNPMAPEELAQRANVDPTKSTMRNAVSALSVHGILERRGRMLRVVDELFPTGPVK